MRKMPLFSAAPPEEEEPAFAKRQQKLECVGEPRSVLDHHSSSPTSSSSLDAARGKEEWAFSDLQPLPPAAAAAAEHAHEWEAVFSESAGSSGAQEHSFLNWVMGEAAEPSSAGKALQLGFEGHCDGSTSSRSGSAGTGFGVVDRAGIVVDPIQLSAQVGRAPGLFLPELPGLLLNQHQQQPHAGTNPSLFLPMHPDLEPQMASSSFSVGPQLKRHQPLTGPDPDFFLRRNQTLPSQQAQMFAPQPGMMLMKPKAEIKSLVPPPLVEQLLQAVKMVEIGNSSGALEILARLNHQLPVPAGKPLLRASFYFKEMLSRILSGSALVPSSPVKSPYDVAMKLGAHKAFNELSPVLHFINFTSVQALLDELGAADRIHIIDFDIGIGGQWSSFMQEIAQRRLTLECTGNITVLKMTAFVTPSTHHLLELHLIRDNLCQFANDLNVPFECSILSLDSFEPSEFLATDGSSEAIAVNLPASSVYGPSFPTLLQLVKQLCPRILISISQGYDRCDLPFSMHFYHAFQSYVSLLDSLDSMEPDLETANKIERFVLFPRFEGSVIGRYHMLDKMLPWKTLFASAGYSLVPFSSMAEAQAECLAKRVQVKGFHVDRRQGSLMLYWHRSELASITAWKGC